MENIWDYWVRKLLFPKTIVIDRPGIIINRVMNKYGGIRCQQRMVFFFEDIMANLQKTTEKKLGQKESCGMWYEIGKDVGTRYLLISNTNKAPQFLAKPILNHIFNGFRGGGQSFAKKFTLDMENMKFRFEGSNNIMCRKTANGNFSAGVVSGVISFITGKNIEAETNCSCPDICRISAKLNYKTRYIPNRENLLPSEDYSKLNFPIKSQHSNELSSFSDMIKFRKIKMANGKWQIGGKFLIPGEIGMLGIISEAFKKRNMGEIFDSTVVEAAETIGKDLLLGKDLDLKQTAALFSALGMGKLQHLKTKNKLQVYIEQPPYSKYSFNYITCVLNGFTNIIMERNLKLDEQNFDGQKLQLSFS